MSVYEITAVLSCPVGETTDLDSFSAAADANEKPTVRVHSGAVIGKVTEVSAIADDRFTLKVEFDSDQVIADIVLQEGGFPLHLQITGNFRQGAKEGLAVLAGIQVLSGPD